MKLSVLRLGHRIFRDKRITTHCALAARALGAGEFLYTGEKDSSLENSVRKTVRNWGGPFEVAHLKSPDPLLKSFPGKKAHLTVYGLPFEDKLPELRKQKSLLVLVGGEKVPPGIYQSADWNLSIGSQPHSEVAALGIFLYELRGFKEEFSSARLRVVPRERGKLLRHGKKGSTTP